MKIKMAAIDLDGTLLHDDMSLSDFSKDIIRKAEHRGIHIVLATGRMFDAARPKAEELGLSDTPLICYTGAWIMMSRSGRPIWQDGIDISVAEKILLTAREKGWLVHTFFDDQIYLPEPNKTEAKYKKYRTKAVAYLGNAFYHPKKKPTRLIFADGSEAVRREIRRVIETNFSDEVEVVFPGDDFVDVHKKGVSKGTALQKLCNMWDISLSEVIAFGNTENDVSMLKMAGISYAVKNADEYACSAAGNICDSNENDGVAKVLAEYLV